MMIRFWQPGQKVNADERIGKGLIVIGVAVGFMVAAIEVMGIGI